MVVSVRMVRRISVLEGAVQPAATAVDTELAQQHGGHDPPGLNGQHDLDHVPLVGGDQLPVDLAGEQRVDMGIANLLGRPVQDRIAQAAHARHQLDGEQAAQAEHGLRLTLGVGVQRIGLDDGLVLQQAVEDVDGFPHTAGNEAVEQRDVVVGDVVVGDAALAAIAAVADVSGAEQVALAQRDVGAVGDGGASAAPVPWQREPGLLVDDVHHRRVQLGPGDMLDIDPAHRLRRRHSWRVPGGLAGAEVAAIAEDGEQVTLDGLCELGVGARRRRPALRAPLSRRPRSPHPV